MSRTFISAFLALILVGHFSSAALSSEGSLTLPSKPDQPITLDLEALSFDKEHLEHSKLMEVFVGSTDACCDDRSPLAGRYELTGGALTFTPAFGFNEKQFYTVRTHTGEVKKLTQFQLQTTKRPIKPIVTDIYPSGSLLPENTLRFYVHFSTPMRPHVAFEHVKLIRESGEEDGAAFMQFKQELWNKDRTRLTVLVDPGRIKRGVSTNLELGPALEAGKRYKLVINGGWSTADGASKLETYERDISVAAGLRELPNTEKWQITSPEAGTRQALEIGFDRPFDVELLSSAITVFSETGEEIAGDIHLENDETHWRFEPSDSWRNQPIKLVVDARLEDVAGNNFRDLLDHSVETGTKNVSSITIPIKLRSGS